MKEQVHLKIFGRVHGVFFRSETYEQARLLGLCGWVRNTSDGGVEVLAQGDRDVLQHFVDWCRKGPTKSRVERTEVQWQPVGEALHDFEIRY